MNKRENRASSLGMSLILCNDSGDDRLIDLLGEIGDIDATTVIESSWEAAVAAVDQGHCLKPDVVVEVLSRNGAVAIDHLRQLWSLRVKFNHAPKPTYLAVSRVKHEAVLRQRIKRYGGHYLLLDEVPSRFRTEIEEIYEQLAWIKCSLPLWKIIYEGYGRNLRIYVYVIGISGEPVRVGGSERMTAVLAALIENNGEFRSLQELRRILHGHAAFRPAGGPFSLPSISSLKMYLHRDFPNHLQAAFDAELTGYSAERVIVKRNLGAKAVGYKILGRRPIRIAP